MAGKAHGERKKGRREAGGPLIPLGSEYEGVLSSDGKMVVVEGETEVDELSRQGAFGIVDWRWEKRMRGEEVIQEIPGIVLPIGSGRKRKAELAQEAGSSRRPRHLQKEKKKWKESPLHLFPEEVFFLADALGKLRVKDSEGILIPNSQLWRRFRGADQGFPQLYAAYYFYRTRGWVVRRGLEFGVDFLLYKEHPELYHSALGVKLIRGETGELAERWSLLAANARNLKISSKRLVLCQAILESNDVDLSHPSSIQYFHIRQVRISPWLPKRHLSHPLTS